MTRGLSLIEITIGMGIMSVLMIGAITFAARLTEFPETTVAAIEQEQSTRTALEQMVDTLRRMTPSETGTYPIESATDSSIAFYVNIDSDNARERVRYFIDGTELKRGMIEPADNPAVYDINQETRATIARDVRIPSPLFTYYDGTYAGVEQPLLPPIPTQNIRYIGIAVTINENPAKPPAAFTLHSGVTPRALKDNL